MDAFWIIAGITLGIFTIAHILISMWLDKGNRDLDGSQDKKKT